MKVIFICGPYRASTPRRIVENIRAAESAAIQVWRLGAVALCPHLNTALMDGICPDSVWLEGALELLSRSDAVLMLHRWQDSEGAKAECAEAQRLELPIFDFSSVGWRDAVRRLIRSECGAINPYLPVHMDPVRCTLPTGHEGDHENNSPTAMYSWSQVK